MHAWDLMQLLILTDCVQVRDRFIQKLQAQIAMDEQSATVMNCRIQQLHHENEVIAELCQVHLSPSHYVGVVCRHATERDSTEGGAAK